MGETFEQKLERVINEKVFLSPWSPCYEDFFLEEKNKLLNQFPSALILRVEHFGSTAIRGMEAKPIIDMLVEVTSFDLAKNLMIPSLESEGYDYFWRQFLENSSERFYMWFIKRGAKGVRTHHIHIYDKTFHDHWNKLLLFRNFLRENPDRAQAYIELKRRLLLSTDGDRVLYTKEKTEFILETVSLAQKDRCKLSNA